ncbi:hypothetical protein B0H21DRAFT_324094 [Amylocystis lapponica]|nr:hypothetical protein B0H21DRAFT_324094 [Amylocystis lapponica]
MLGNARRPRCTEVCAAFSMAHGSRVRTPEELSQRTIYGNNRGSQHVRLAMKEGSLRRCHGHGQGPEPLSDTLTTFRESSVTACSSQWYRSVVLHGKVCESPYASITAFRAASLVATHLLLSRRPHVVASANPFSALHPCAFGILDAAGPVDGPELPSPSLQGNLTPPPTDMDISAKHCAHTSKTFHQVSTCQLPHLIRRLVSLQGSLSLSSAQRPLTCLYLTPKCATSVTITRCLRNVILCVCHQLAEPHARSPDQ